MQQQQGTTQQVLQQQRVMQQQQQAQFQLRQIRGGGGQHEWMFDSSRGLM